MFISVYIDSDRIYTLIFFSLFWTLGKKNDSCNLKNVFYS